MKIWGSSAPSGQILPISDTNFAAGFYYLGNNPPTAEEFNWLFQQVTQGIVDAGKSWQANTAYELGHILYTTSFAQSFKRFECTVAGTSGTTEPTWPMDGQTVSDGTATWKIIDVKNLLHLAGGSLTGALNEAKGINIASAATTNIGSATGNFAQVTGTTTITSLGTAQAGSRRTVNFTGSLTLTHNATSLILPGSTNLVINAGDTCEFYSLGSGNWILTGYEPATTMSMQNQKIVNLLAGVNTGDAVNMGQLLGVVTSGSGWVKFSDGTMIQRGSSLASTVGSSPAYANINFPLSFYDATYSMTCMHSGTYPLIVAENFADRSVNHTVVWMQRYDNSVSPAGGWTCMYIAIGRWKA